MTLKEKTINGVKWTTVSTVIVTVIQILQLSILARFLAPTDFGLMAIVMVVIGFSQTFLDMGISNAIIYKQSITKEQLSTLYWLNVIMGFALFVLICVLSPLASLFFKEPELSKLIILIGLTFLIQPFGQQFMVLWQKEMRFSEMSKIDISTKMISLAVSVVFAYSGYGVYALVYGTLASAVLQTVLFVRIGMREHRPQLLFRWGEIHEFVGFGVFQMGERIINYFNSQIDVIIIGKLLGAEVLGIYNIAKQLIMRPTQIVNPIVTKVTFPVMAKLQYDVATLKTVYLKTVLYLSSVNFPIYAMLIVLAPEIVLLLFGEKWLMAVPIVQILSLYGAVRSTVNPIGSLMLAKGRANLGFYWNLGLLLYVPTCIALVSRWGLMGVSWILVALQLSLILPSWYILVRPLCGAKLSEYIVKMTNPLILTLIAGMLAYFGIIFLGNSLSRFLIGLVIGGVVYIALSWQFNHAWVSAMVELFAGRLIAARR